MAANKSSRKEKLRTINQTMIRGARCVRQQVGHDLKELYVNKVQQFLDRGKSQTYAENAAFNALWLVWRGRLRRTYLERLKWIHRIKLDPVHRKVMKTLRCFIDEDYMDFDEAAGSAVEKRKFLAKQSRAGEVTPRRVGWWRRSQRRGRSVRECDGSVFTHYIVRRQSRWIAAIHHWRITRRAFVEVSTINDIIQRTGNESWPDKNNGVQRILRL